MLTHHRETISMHHPPHPTPSGVASKPQTFYTGITYIPTVEMCNLLMAFLVISDKVRVLWNRSIN